MWAEVAGSFASAAAAQNALKLLSLEFSSLSVASALEAGIAWKLYRARSGPKTRVDRLSCIAYVEDIR